MELITIVDKNDDVIGYKKRADLNKSDIIRVSALWVVNSKKQTLLAQRSFNKKLDPGKWGPAVEGTLNKDENYEENIYRQARNELGIEARGFIKGTRLLLNFDFPFYVQWYICTLELNARRFEIQKEEVEQVDWFNMQELFKDIDMNPDKYVKSASVWHEIFADIT